MRSRVLRWGTLVCALVMSPLLVPAQEFRGQIGGAITDPSGASIPGAQITITNIATNIASTTLANEAGSYTILYLVPGRYAVLVEAPGFKKLVRQGIEVRVGDALKLDLTLELGGAQDVVNVTSEAPLLETSTATAG
jgi:hypothetical protein